MKKPNEFKSFQEVLESVTEAVMKLQALIEGVSNAEKRKFGSPLSSPITSVRLSDKNIAKKNADLVLEIQETFEYLDSISFLIFGEADGAQSSVNNYIRECQETGTYNIKKNEKQQLLERAKSISILSVEIHKNHSNLLKNDYKQIKMEINENNSIPDMVRMLCGGLLEDAKYIEMLANETSVLISDLESMDAEVVPEIYLAKVKFLEVSGREKKIKNPEQLPLFIREYVGLKGGLFTADTTAETKEVPDISVNKETPDMSVNDEKPSDTPSGPSTRS